VFRRLSNEKIPGTKAISAVNPLTYLTELGRDAVTYGMPHDATAFIYLAVFSAALTLVERLLTAD